MLITNLTIFDFDGTLIDTELPETGKGIWKEKTGREWPHIGWWSKPESLSLEHFANKPFNSVIEVYKQEKMKDDTMVVMLTGRCQSLSKYVRAILDHQNIEFDMYLYNYGGSTFQNKITQISEVLSNNPNINDLRMFDDKHIPQFQTFGNELITNKVINKFNITHVSKGKFLN